VSLSRAAALDRPAGDRRGRADQLGFADACRSTDAADLGARPARTALSSSDGLDHTGGRSRNAYDNAGIAALEAPPEPAGDEVSTAGQSRVIISSEIMRLHPLGDLVSAGSPVSSLGPQSLGLILPLSQFPTGHFPRYPAHSTIAIPRFQRIVSIEIRWSPETHRLAGGPATVRMAASFEWIEDSHFLMQRQGGSGGPPQARWLIGRDDSSGEYCVLYADARGISRVYRMSFESRLWRIWRDAPGFCQRFEGRLSADGSIIEARWEKSVDGKTWEHDFDLKYVKAER